MNRKVIAILGTGALAVIAGVVVIEMGRSREAGSSESASARPLVFPSLAEKVNDVAEVDIVRNGATFTIKRGASGWELADRGGYPVPFEKVKQVAVGLSQLRIVEEKTSRPDKYKLIGVQDPDPKPSGEPEGWGGPSQVTLKDGNGAVLASAIVGNQRSSSGVYVRRAGEAQSYAAEGTVDVPGGVTAWVDPKMFEVGNARVKSVAIHQPGGEVLQLSKATPEQANFTVADVPAGKELKSAGAGDAAGNALAYMSFEDVAPAATIDFTGKDEKVKPGPTAEYRTFDGEVFTVQTADKDGKTWMQVAVAYDAAANPPTPEGQTPPPPRPGQKTPEEAKKEAEELSAKLSRWAFQVPEYKSNLFKTKMADLLKEPAGAPGAEGTPGAIPAPASMPETLPVAPPSPPANPPAPSSPPAANPPPSAPPAEAPPAGEQPKPQTPPTNPGA
jgi:hypothetical protein